jgi:hypothetical protein
MPKRQAGTGIMNKSGLYGLVGIMGIVVLVLVGYLIYQEQNKPRLEIKVDGNGIEVTGNK